MVLTVRQHLGYLMHLFVHFLKQGKVYLKPFYSTKEGGGEYLQVGDYDNKVFCCF